MQKDIAKEVGLTPQAVSYIVHSPVFQREYELRRLILSEKADRAYLESL